MNSIFYFAASNLLVACLLAVLAYVVGRSGRHAVTAHCLWLLVFVKLVTPPLVSTPIAVPQAWAQPTLALLVEIQETNLSSADEVHPAESSETGTSVGQAAQTIAAVRGMAFRPNFAQCVVLLWIAGTVLIVSRGAVRFARFSYLLHRESLVDALATQQVRDLLGRDRFVPQVRLISARVSPMLFGFGKRTCIVCPDRLWNSLDAEQRRAFLAHEVAHFRRRDHWVRWLEWLVTAIYWWLPLVYFARQQLERHEEAACDAWAIANLSTPPRAYAETLLSVVDFLSETRIGIPRLASRMQATDSLEERLRLIMSSDAAPLSPIKWRGLMLFSGVLILVHPSFHYRSNAETAPANRDARARIETDLTLMDGSSPHEPVGRDTTGLSAEVSLDRLPLPPRPRGWWNEPPAMRFADLRLGESNLRLLAEAGVGVTIQDDNGTFTFEPASVRALAHVPSRSRVIIGSTTGDLHLWDVPASQAVSLIGKHQAAITNLAFHLAEGLVSGDVEGNLIRWDHQSGEMLGLRPLERSVASIRWSRSGKQLAVLTGDWNAPGDAMQLLMLDGRSLETQQQLELPGTIAVVQQDERLGWLAVDWGGEVWSLASGQLEGHVPKSIVSGMVLCQDLFAPTMKTKLK